MYPKSTGNIVTISVDDLKKQFQIVGLDWLELLQLITGKQNVNGKIQIDLDYFTILIDEMSRLKFNTETLKYFLLISQGLTWYENTVVRKSVERSEFYCIGLTRQLMPDVTNYIFQKITPKEKFKNDRQLKYVADIQNKIEKAFNNSVVSDVQWTKMIRNIRFVTETPHDTKFEVALQKVYGPVALAGDFQVDLYKLIKIYRKQIFNLTFSRDSKEKNKLFTYFINSYDENPHLFNSINTIAIPFGMFYSVSENLPEVIRYSKLTFRLARAIMKKFNLNTIRTMGKYIETIYENVLYNSLYDTISDYAGKSISLDFESDLSAENRLLENSAFSIVDLYKPNVSQKLPWFSNYTSSQIFYLTAAQEYCLDKEDLIDFMYKSKTNNPLSAAYQIENIVYNTPNFFNCVNDDAVSFPLHTLKENNS
ncbi:uncharacterized protein LOC126264989 isoform X2 [Aethina tumida]|uniref:uncharacterized protein LOC126264989 isoform X2 n=1 Tax=Aethina tumida TaxID=116153 RepID=UPI002147B2E5|nr:uncharacterized protein LOC126264989 isoform X2 [Aethina tumida]